MLGLGGGFFGVGRLASQHLAWRVGLVGGWDPLLCLRCAVGGKFCALEVREAVQDWFDGLLLAAFDELG